MVRVGAYKRPSILYRGASSRSMSQRGLERTAGIPFMPSTTDRGVASGYALDQVEFEGGTPIVVIFKSVGLKIEKDETFGDSWISQWNVLEDYIPKKNIVAVERRR